MKLYHPTILGVAVTVPKKDAAAWLASGWVKTDPTEKAAPATE